jgi:hypothetical protein
MYILSPFLFLGQLVSVKLRYYKVKVKQCVGLLLKVARAEIHSIPPKIARYLHSALVNPVLHICSICSIYPMVDTGCNFLRRPTFQQIVVNFFLIRQSAFYN